jgi:hypothetical protein
MRGGTTHQRRGILGVTEEIKRIISVKGKDPSLEIPSLFFILHLNKILRPRSK